MEFALLLPLLVMFLFGIIQYGYGLYQLQAFNSALDNASQLAATGITSCSSFQGTLQSLVSADGIAGSALRTVNVDWLNPDGTTTDVPQRSGLVKVSASYATFKIGIPGIPFPSTITRSLTVPIQDIGLSSITSCLWTSPATPTS